MAGAMNPTGPNGPTGPTGPTGPMNPMEPASPTYDANQYGANQYGANQYGQAPSRPVTVPRPGLVTFAAIMIFLLGGFQIVFAVVEFSNAVWFATTVYGTFNGTLWLWGIVDGIFGLVALYAGMDLLVGGSFGQVVGIAIAAVSAVRWFFYLPAQPWTAVVIIAIDVLIIYGLVAHSEYFNNAQTQ